MLKGVADEEITEPSQEFVLEKHLEEFIVSKFDQIFGGQLVLYSDSEGRDGRQYPTSVGNIDILAREPATGSYVVIELKKGQESDRVVGQITRYMGWVRDNLCEGEEDVRGLIICKDVDERLMCALRVASKIEARCYKVWFELCPPDDLISA